MAKKGNTGPGTGPARAPARGANKAPSGPRSQKGVPMGSKVPSGGGINSNKLRRPPIVTGKPTTRAINQAAAADPGTAKGTHVMNAVDDGSGRNTQEARRPPEPLVMATPRAPVPKLGNAAALDGLAGGRGKPGADRTVYRSGSQSQYGPANPGGPPLPQTPGGGPSGFGFTGKGDR